ncbi:MAG: SWIM zinc finger domain-containing protein [Saprospiraceae bacterium]
MNFEIKNIETFFPEKVVEQAEALLQEGLVQGIVYLEKKIWTMKVGESYENLKDGNAFEVEIQMSGKKVKRGTCDCDFYQQNLSSKNNHCKHIVAGLFALRKHLLEKELERQKAIRVTPFKHKRLTTISVLNSVDPEALKNFVRAYARTDKKFALSLKARFAHAVEVENDKEKYLQLLQATFSSVTTTKDKIKYNSLQQVQLVITDILDHVDDAIALEHYSEASDILQAIIIKLSPNIKRAENHEDRILALLNSTFSFLKNLIKKDLPPELKGEIWQFCFENFDGREHKKYETNTHFLAFLLELTTEKKYAKILLEKINNEIANTFDKKKKGVLLLFKMKLVEQFEKTSLSAFIEENLEESEILLAAIKNAVSQENYDDAKHLALKGLEMQKNVTVRNELDDILLNIGLKTQHIQDITIYARKRFLVTFEFHFYQILKNTVSKGWKKEVKNLLNLIEGQPFSPQKKITFAEIFAKEKMHKELIEFIKKNRSLDLLEKYDIQLIDDFKKEIFELYEDLLDGYLRNHLGRQTSTKIRDIFYHLKKIGAKKLVYKLAKQYREEYPERHTLMEELGMF